MKKLNNWFEIDEHQYLMYLLKGYRIRADSYAVAWVLNNQVHREDGPAVIYDDGSRYWYLNAVSYTEAEFNEAIKRLV